MKRLIAANADQEEFASARKRKLYLKLLSMGRIKHTMQAKLYRKRLTMTASVELKASMLGCH